MTLKTTQLRDAITLALAVGALAGTGAAFAQDAATPPAGGEANQLDRIEVTGSRIRRVDAENASPVVTIDRAAIEKTGKLTLGDLVQELPAVSGSPTNPQVNNGGGTGASAIDLRGFGSQRTLLLIDGRRAVSNDVNSIPASAVERIEVLTTGASSVYGSDAVAGVVNFIMRKDFEGAQASINYGVSSRKDGERAGGSLTFGMAGDKGNIIGGVDYNKFESISSNDREFSRNATYLSYGSVFNAGSSRNPFGRVFLPANSALRAQYGCASVTRIAGTSGATQANYRCYNGATDAFNYQATNLIQTPQERTNAFVFANYQLADDVTGFLKVFHNKTSSGFAIAALPFDANADGVVISAQNAYNPFGIDFGGGGPNLVTRFTSLGQRQSFNSTTTDQLVAGVEGFLGDTWKWDFALNYGHISQSSQTKGYVYYDALRSALGPSFVDGTGALRCGTAAAPIANCTPLNIFNITDPQTVQTLRQYAASPLSSVSTVQRGFEANASGDLFEMPAGPAQLAFGAQWRKEYQRNEVDFIAIADPQGRCRISQEACGSALSGGFSVGDLYGEIFLPLLKDVPFAQALNVTFGSRYSNYSNFGTNVSNKLQVEWRPISDLLLRGTVAEVFRAPQIGDIFGGPAGNSPQATDPCVGYTNSPAHAAACGPARGATAIPATGIEAPATRQLTGVLSGSAYRGINLVPEQGRSYDWGLVYDPSWLSGFSASVDYWRLSLNDTIGAVGAQTVLNQCYQNNGGQFCGYIHRNSDGQIDYIEQPTVNLGRLDAAGYDVALRYKLPWNAYGSFTTGLDATYISRWDNDVDPNGSSDAVVHVAGTYNKDYGNYARVRARAYLNWSMGDWSASWRTRYIGPFNVGNADVRQDASADAGCQRDPATNVPNEFCGVELGYGSYVNHSVQIGYALPSANSRFELGVDNVFDKQPPLLYQNNVLNANTDVSNFDTIGRYYWARYTVKF